LFRNPHAIKVLHGYFFSLYPRHPACPGWGKGQILENGHVGEQVETLENHSDFTADSFYVFEVIGQFCSINNNPSFLMRFQAIYTPY
jgi:hypothetical protein